VQRATEKGWAFYKNVLLTKSSAAKFGWKDVAQLTRWILFSPHLKYFDLAQSHLVCDLGKSFCNRQTLNVDCAHGEMWLFPMSPWNDQTALLFLCFSERANAASLQATLLL